MANAGSDDNQNDAQEAVEGQANAVPPQLQPLRIKESLPFPGFPEPHSPPCHPAPICSDTPRLAPISLAAPVAPAELITPVLPCITDSSLECPSWTHIPPRPFVITQQALAHALKPASLHIPACLELCVRSSPSDAGFSTCKVQLGGIQQPSGMGRDVPALDGVGLKLRQLGASHAMRVSLAAAAAVQLSGTAEALLQDAGLEKAATVMQPCVAGSMVADVSGPAKAHPPSHDPAPAHPVVDGASEALARGTGSHPGADQTSPAESGIRSMQDSSLLSQVSSFGGIPHQTASNLPVGQQPAAASRQYVNPAVLMSTFGYESDDSSLDMDLPEEFRDEEHSRQSRRDFADEILATNASLQDWTGSASHLDTNVSLAGNAESDPDDTSGNDSHKTA